MTTYYESCGPFPFSLMATTSNDVGKCGENMHLEDGKCVVDASCDMAPYREAMAVMTKMQFCEQNPGLDWCDALRAEFGSEDTGPPTHKALAVAAALQSNPMYDCAKATIESEVERCAGTPLRTRQENAHMGAPGTETTRASWTR